MRRKVNLPMFLMVLTNEVVGHAIDINKGKGVIYIEDEYVDKVNSKLADLGVFNQTDSINLKDILGDEYNQEYMNYLFDDVWVANGCI